MAIAATMSLIYSLIFTAFGYVVPGYQTFKAIELKGVSEDVRLWAEYWVVFAAFIVLQPFADLVLSWLPFYYLAKLAFLAALWHPASRWSHSIYDKVFNPLISSYEADIDRLYMDARTKAADMIEQHASTLRTQARTLSGRATVALKGIQQKALERAKAARAPGGADGGAAGHGLHTE